jgi:hypothetical protein
MSMGQATRSRLVVLGLQTPQFYFAPGDTNVFTGLEDADWWAFCKNDGTLEAAQRIAGHADSRTTKLYDRRGQKVLLEDMERIRY